MRPASNNHLFVAAALAVLLLCGRAGAKTDPFELASVAPPDVTLFVHIEGAAAFRRELADRPIAAWIHSALADGAMMGAWSRLSRAAQSKPGILFDRCLGESFTAMARRPADERETSATSWVVVTSMPETTSQQLLRQLKARVREPRFGMAIAELPEEALLLARDGASVIVGPTGQSDLFMDVVERISQRRTPSLRHDEPFKRVAELGAGRAGVFVRHDKPMGGWSMAVADLDGNQLTVRHIGRFENAPFAHEVTRLTCDFSPVMAFEQSSLLALMQPMDASSSPFESFFSATASTNVIPRSVRDDLGNRRLMVFNETSGPPPQRSADVLAQTLVSCLELKNPEAAAPKIEQHLASLADRNACLGQGALLTPSETSPPSKARDAMPTTTSSWLTGGFPVMSTMKLCWTVADGPQGCWFVIAGDSQHRDSVAAILRGECAPEPCMVGRLDSCGVGNGVRISKQLQSWREQAKRGAQPQGTEEFVSTLSALSDLAAGIATCRWQLARPNVDEMRLDVQVTLTPRDSAAKE